MASPIMIEHAEGHRNRQENPLKVYLDPYHNEVKNFVNHYPIISAVVAVAALIFGFQNIVSFSLINLVKGSMELLFAYAVGRHFWNHSDRLFNLASLSVLWNDPQQRQGINWQIRDEIDAIEQAEVNIDIPPVAGQRDYRRDQDDFKHSEESSQFYSERSSLDPLPRHSSFSAQDSSS